MTTGRVVTPGRWMFIRSVWWAVGATIVMSVAAYFAGLPNNGHGHSVRAADLFYGNGTALAPPLLWVCVVVPLLMVPVMLRTSPKGFYVTAAVILTVGIAADALANILTMTAAPQFTGTRWYVFLAMDSLLTAFLVAVVVCAIVWPFRSRRAAARASRSPQPARIM